jgi:hypothetical protein
LAFGHVEFSVTTSIIVGSVPAVLVGSFLSSRAPDRIVRPIITFVIFASGLKYVGVSTTTLGWILCVTALLVAAVWTARTRPWRNGIRGSTVEMDAGGAPPIDSGVAPVDERRRT